MTLIHVLLGEHGAMYPLLERIEQTAPRADLQVLKTQASLLESVLISHANLEDSLLRPVLQQYFPQAEPAADGTIPLTDHEVIGAGLAQVMDSMDERAARHWLLDTVAKTRKHFLKEETIIFAVARRELSPEGQSKLAVEWARRRGVSVN